jgi:hypothetical protein
MPLGVSQDRIWTEKEIDAQEHWWSPWWSATETIFKDTFISAGVTAFRQWLGTSARQSFMRKALAIAVPVTCALMMDDKEWPLVD